MEIPVISNAQFNLCLISVFTILSEKLFRAVDGMLTDGNCNP